MIKEKEKQKIAFDICNCNRCKHQWASRLGRKPAACPKCKSYDWNKPKK